MDIMAIHCNFAYNGFFYNKGSVAQCCMQESLFRKNDWTDVSDLNEFYKKNISSRFAEVRSALESDIKHPACQSCWNDESIYGSSMRTSNSTFKENTESIIPDIKFVDLRLSNKCNLQCKMCSPNDSSQLTNLSLELTKEGISNPFEDMIPENENFNSNDLLDLVLKVPNLESMRFAGGEPFLMPEVEEFLKSLIQIQKTNLSIEFITNCTSVKPRLISLLSEFKDVKINCSIDGIEKTIEYQRYPVSWKAVEKNFLRLYESNLFKISLVPCVGILNYLTLDEFFNWANQYPNAHISYNEIYDPSFFNFRYIPNEYRRSFYEKFSLIELKNTDSKWQQFQKQTMYECAEPTQEDCNMLYQYSTNMWDRRGKVKFLDVHPWANYMISRAIK